MGDHPKMRSMYCGTEDFVTVVTGDAMAKAIKRAVALLDADLAARLVFDPEAGGVGITAPTEFDLREAMSVAAHARLVTPEYLDRLDAELEAEEDLDDSGEPSADSGFEAMPVPHAAARDEVVAWLNQAMFSQIATTESTISDLAGRATSALDAHGWASKVRVEIEPGGQGLFLMAPDVETLRRATDAIGSAGLPESAEETFRRMAEDALRDPADSPPDWSLHHRDPPSGHWITRGPLGDIVGVDLAGTFEEAAQSVHEHLVSLEVSTADRVVITIDPDWNLLIVGARHEDVARAVVLLTA